MKFMSSVFLVHIPKNKCQDLKVGYIDVSRRQLQSALKIRVQTIFLGKITAILVLLDHFDILSTFF